jgi:hypothetical protein
MLRTIRSWSASQASSNQEIAATASSPASLSAFVASLLIRSGSADHQ